MYKTQIAKVTQNLSLHVRVHDYREKVSKACELFKNLNQSLYLMYVIIILNEYQFLSMRDLCMIFTSDR